MGDGWRGKPYPAVEIVAAELDSRVGHDADAIGAIPAHETLPALFLPHLAERLAHRELVLCAAGALDLEQDLEALKGGDDGSRHGASDTAGAEGGNYGL